jgi:hypothetical protein
MPSSSLGVMTLLHSRHHCLLPIYADICRLAAGARHVHWQIVLNKPTNMVLETLNYILTHDRRGMMIDVLEAPFSPLDNIERFIELRRWQYERLPVTTWGVIWDDDHVLADSEEARIKLTSKDDLVYATKLFFWDDDEHYTSHIPTHRSVFFFRRLENDQFPADRGIHAPALIHDRGGPQSDLRAPLLDYGYMARVDRERCWLDYRRVGKIDAATLPLTRDPILHHWPGPYPLRARDRQDLKAQYATHDGPRRSQEWLNRDAQAR